MRTQKGEKYIQLNNQIFFFFFSSLNLPSCNIRNSQEIGHKVKWRVENSGGDSMKRRLNVSESRPAHL